MKRLTTVALVCMTGLAYAAEWKIEATPDRLDGIYRKGETVTFVARLLRDGYPPLAEEGYRIFLAVSMNGRPVTNLTANAYGDVKLSFVAPREGWASCFAQARTPDNKELLRTSEEEPNKWRRQVRVQCGAMIDPELCRQGAPEPDDFDAYWAAERKAVLTSPANAKFERNPDPSLAGRNDCFVFSADLPGGFAGPTAQVQIPQDKSRKYPIHIFVHGAGVHAPRPGTSGGRPIPLAFRETFTGPVIGCNLNAHGYRLGEPEAFYRDLDAGALKDYQFQGSESDRTWYMKGLALRLIRTIDELCKLPEWDGRNVIVSGGSQGGAQALIAGGLDRRVNFVAADVPAMCDFGGELAGHAAGWPRPYHVADGRFVRSIQFADQVKTAVPDDESCVRRFGYMDAVNFAARINPDAFVAITTGGYDGVCPPTGVFAAYWRCPARTKTMQFAPLGGHCQGDYLDGQLQLPAEWRGTERVTEKEGFDPVITEEDGVRTMRLYAYDTYAGAGRNRSWKYLVVDDVRTRTLYFTGTKVEFVSNGVSWDSAQAELWLDGRRDGALKTKLYRHQRKGVRTIVAEGCPNSPHTLLIRVRDPFVWADLGLGEIVVTGPVAKPAPYVWSEMTPLQLVDSIYPSGCNKTHPEPASWFEMSAKEFLPFIDRYGQFKFRDWPGKVKGDADLKAAAEAEAKDLAAHPGPPDWDEYGGWTKGPRQDATGRFHAKKIDGKWWLVDPKGNLFWSFGAVRVTPSSAMTPLDGNGKPDRDVFFEDLPAQGSEFAKFYETYDELLLPFYRKHQETRHFDFSSANLYRKYGRGYYETFADLAHRRLRSWGVNTIANSSDIRICLMDRTPYAERIECLSRPIAGAAASWWKFRDPWDPTFTSNLLDSLRAHGREAHDPWCIGFFVDNEINWGKDDLALAKWTLASPDDQPAKIEFFRRLKAKGIDPRNVPDAELKAFTLAVIDEYFRRTRETLKAFDPQLLYLGCRFAGSRDSILKTAAKYCDVISYNIYTATVEDFRLPCGIDAPMIIGEFHFGALDRGPFGRTLRRTTDQRARGEAMKRYVISALRNPQIVGAHWHQFSDQATTGRFDGEFFQVGWTDVCDTPYVETIEALRSIELYATRSR